MSVTSGKQMATEQDAFEAKVTRQKMQLILALMGIKIQIYYSKNIALGIVII